MGKDGALTAGGRRVFLKQLRTSTRVPWRRPRCYMLQAEKHAPPSPPNATAAPAPRRRNTEHDAPYWRGQIWIPINYLALRSLHSYSSLPGPHAAAAGDAYRRLRRALVGNLVTQYHRTGYLWEQYDAGSGKGMSSHPFTGWTALLTLAAGEAF